MVPESYGVEIAALKEMVCDINATEVKEEEVLSNSVYRYDRAKRTIVVAEED